MLCPRHVAFIQAFVFTFNFEPTIYDTLHMILIALKTAVGTHFICEKFLVSRRNRGSDFTMEVS